jgi:hypothetical protein
VKHAKREVEDPHTLTLKQLCRTLKYVGEPETDDEWQRFCEISGLDDLREVVPKAIRASQALYADRERQGDPEELLRDAPEFVGVLTVKWASAIITSRMFFSELRQFLRDKYDERLLRQLKSVPPWWRHEEYDPALFRHLAKFGFARPCVMLAETPFLELVPDKAKRQVQERAAKSMGKCRRLKIDKQWIRESTPLELLCSKRRMQDHVKGIVSDLTVELAPAIRLEIEEKYMRPLNLPRILDQSIVESLGSGKFGAVNNYLYRVGFRARYRLANKIYTCKVVDDLMEPFEILTEQNMRFGGASPPEAWAEALRDENLPADPYEMFGIGLIPIRYWMQKGLGDEKVYSHRPIRFETQQRLDVRPAAGPHGWAPQIRKPIRRT